MTKKKCSKCGIVKPLFEFYKSKKEKDGLQYRCKDCNKIAARLSTRKSRATPEGREKNARTLRRFRVDPKNREKQNQASLRWQKQNLARASIKNHRYKAQKLNAIPVWFEVDKVKLIYEKAKEWGFEVDHVIPLQGKNVCGLHCWANLQLLDKPLNSSKGNREYPDH